MNGFHTGKFLAVGPEPKFPDPESIRQLMAINYNDHDKGRERDWIMSGYRSRIVIYGLYNWSYRNHDPFQKYMTRSQSQIERGHDQRRDQDFIRIRVWYIGTISRSQN